MPNFGTTPTSTTVLPTNQFPVSAAFVPNSGAAGNLTSIEGIAVNTDTNGFQTTAVRMGLKDGDDATQGFTTDAAVTGDVAGTLSAKLRGLSKILAPLQFDGSNFLKVNAAAGTITANIGTTNGLALDSSVNGLLVAQGSTTSGEKGPLAQGAVTTNAPSYTTAQTSPLSLDTSGLLRASLKDTPSNTNNLNVNLAASAATVTVSATNLQSNIAQVGGVNISTGTGASGAGIPRVTVSNDSNILATQSGTWTVSASGNFNNASVGAVGAGAPGSATQAGGTDGANLRSVFMTQAHNADNQTPPASGYSFLVSTNSGVLNPAGTVDRARGTGQDAAPLVGIPSGAQQLIGPALSTTLNGAVTGSTSAQSVAVVSSTSAKVGDIVLTQDNPEYVEITAIADTTHVTGVFKNNHASGQSLTWYHANMARDATVGDNVGGTGISPSATYLYNQVSGNFEFDRSANGERDGASGQGTAVAAEYEFNANPLANGSVLSGLQFDRARNVQAGGLGAGTISNNPLAANSTTLTLTSAPTTLDKGAQLVLDRAGANPETNYVATSYTPGSTSVPLQIATQFSHAQNATVEWSQHAPLGPQLSGFLPSGLGMEEEIVFDPASKKYYVEIAATADANSGQNLVIESPGLYNNATFDRARSAYGDALASTGIEAASEMLWNGSSFDRARSIAIGDGAASTGIGADGIMLYNGSTYDRLKDTLVAGAANVSIANTPTVTANQGGSNWSINIAQVAGGTTSSAGQTGSMQVGGAVATNTAVSTATNPLLVAGSDYGGTPKVQTLKVDSSGNGQVNVSQINGQAPTLDNTTVLGVSMRGKNSTAGDTPVKVNSSGDQYVLGDFTEQSGLSAGSLNADLVASTDVSAYAWMSLHITALASGGNITFQGSNDNFATQIESVNLSRVSSSSTNLSVATSTGIFEGPVNFRYFRARQTAWSSGSTTGVLELFTVPRVLNTLPVSQGGTWNVNNGSDLTVFASGAQTATQTQGDQTNSSNARGIKVVLDMTNVTSAPSVTLEIDGRDTTSGKYYSILTGAAVTTVSTNVYTIYPGLSAVANSTANDVLPHTWRVKVTANNANSGTYSVGASLLP